MHLFNTNYKYINSATDDGMTYRLIRSFNANTSYRFDIDAKWNITPSVILYSTQGMPVYSMATLGVEYLNDYRLAVGYRTDQSLVVSYSMFLSGNLFIGYSFELPMNNYAAATGNTHEITLGIRLFGRSGAAPANRREVSRRDLEQLSEIVRMQSMQIDELMEETEKLKNNAARQQQRFDSQRAELEDIIARTAEMITTHSEEIENLKKESITPEEIDQTSDEITQKIGNYAVILAVYNRLEDAKLYQKIIERELGLESSIYDRGGQTPFLVYSRTVGTTQEAQAEYRRLLNMGIENYIYGNLWIYQIKN